MTVAALIPGLLRSYTGGEARVDVALGDDATVDAALRALDQRFAGFRFRIVDEQNAIRPHIKIFVDHRQVHALAELLDDGTELMIVGALSGG
jgi:molybdopterin converting factor small subunit